VRDLWLATRALGIALCAPLLVHLRAEHLALALEPRATRGRRSSADVTGRIEEVLRITDAVLRRGQPAVRSGCLVRGVTRYWCLRRSDVDAALCFGVGRVGGEIASHCWVVVDGRPLREPEDLEQFAELYRICAPGRIAVTA
jgi:hypothetical protein